MRHSVVNRLLVVFCLLGLCSCNRNESEEVARLKKELDAAKAEAAAANDELGQLKSAKKDGLNSLANSPAKDEGLSIQSGEISLACEDVFYARPYASPPALKIDNKDSNLILYTITEQRRDGFRLRIEGSQSSPPLPPARYEARGVPAK